MLFKFQYFSLYMYAFIRDYISYYYIKNIFHISHVRMTFYHIRLISNIHGNYMIIRGLIGTCFGDIVDSIILYIMNQLLYLKKERH